MKTREDYMNAIGASVLPDDSDSRLSGQRLMAIQSLLTVASTLAATLGENSVDCPHAHIDEATDQMLKILCDTFDLRYHGG